MLAKIQALILAAGRGSRLGERSRGTPKCLLEVGRRRLIEHQLDALAEAGVGPTALVLGYGAPEVRELVGERAEFLENPRWEVTNSLYSFAVARDWVKGPLLVLNCDVLFAPDVLDRLLAREGDAIAIDSGSGTAREHMKVKLDEGGRLVDMAKDLPAEEAGGENVGILKLSEQTASELFARAQRLVEAGEEQRWLGSAVRDLARESPIPTVDVAGVPWVEIDFPVDLDRARKEVWPAIRGSAWKRRVRWRATRWAVLVLSVVLAGVSVRVLWPPPPAGTRVEWETVPLEALEATRVTVAGRHQVWAVLRSGGTARAAVEGPGPVRVETRLLDLEGDEAPYVLEMRLDGARLDWFKLTTRPSGKASHPRWRVAHKKRVTLPVPSGEHRLEVSIVAPHPSHVLLRIRQTSPSDEE